MNRSRTMMLRVGFGAMAASAIGGAAYAQQAASTLLGVNCNAPPMYHCPERAVDCTGATTTQPGNTVEPRTRRTFFLDCPAGYRPGDKVNLLLSLHGGGSYANWQRNYFPAMDVKDKYKLVIITPGSPTRAWGPEDDGYLQNMIDQVVGAVGKTNVDRFILAGHSQGGATSARIICTPYFRDKVDVRISLSGGRIGPTVAAGRGFGGGGLPLWQQAPGQAPAAAPGRAGAAAGRGGAPASGAAAGRGGQPAAGAPAAAAPGRGGAAAGPPGGDCDYSFIYTAGEFENTPAPTSPLAEKYACQPRRQEPIVIDQRPGYVWDSTRQDPGTEGWGQYPRSGWAEVYVFPGCKDGRVIADVSRMRKGHTEGLEPNVTDKIMQLATSARGGKIATGSWSPPAPAAAGRGGAPGRGGAAPGRGG